VLCSLALSRLLSMLIEVGKEKFDIDPEVGLAGIGAFVDAGVGGTDEGGDGNIRIEVFANHLLSSSAVIGPMYVACGALVDSSRTASSLGCLLSFGKYAAISKYTS
jgi:hypothetical protein